MIILNKLVKCKQWIMRIVSQCNLTDKKRDGYDVRMCANCGHEEEMHITQRWCWRCRNGR